VLVDPAIAISPGLSPVIRNCTRMNSKSSSRQSVKLNLALDIVPIGRDEHAMRVRDALPASGSGAVA
jgi:hypothetical protein